MGRAVSRVCKGVRSITGTGGVTLSAKMVSLCQQKWCHFVSIVVSLCEFNVDVLDTNLCIIFVNKSIMMN